MHMHTQVQSKILDPEFIKGMVRQVEECSTVSYICVRAFYTYNINKYIHVAGHRHMDHVAPMDAERPLCRSKNEGTT